MTKKLFEVNGIKIGKGFEPYIIAELSANHGGSIERAKASISAAKKAGVSAVKIQSYTPDTMTIESDKSDFQIKEGLWKGNSLYSLYAGAYTPFEWHKELFDYAKGIGVTIFSTPFDESAVDLLESLHVAAYKIASFELTDLPLIEYVAKKQKPMFMSTGMASIEEITEAVKTVNQCGNHQLLLFHCISSYPAATEESNLSNIILLEEEFGVQVGLSDHTISNVASIAAVVMGAVAIEKHFKLDGDDCGPDSSFSLDPGQLLALVEDCNQAKLAMGAKGFSRSDSEESNRTFRRSLYFVKDLCQGEIVTESDIRRIRPGYGLPPKFFNKIVGKTLIKSVERGDSVQWDCF